MLKQPAAKTGAAPGQFDWHRKPSGWSGAPCPICGCPAKRLKALHRALPAEEMHRRSRAQGSLVLWVKTIRVAFGTDSSIEAIS